MTPGMRWMLSTQRGRSLSYARQGMTRTYVWDGQEKTIKLQKRREIWNGLTGIYDPASAWIDTSVRIVAQEGQLHVESVDEALEWMRLGAGVGWVYTDEGLLVGFLKTPQRNQINVDVVQVYVQGKKPTTMPGATNEAIKVAAPPQFAALTSTPLEPDPVDSPSRPLDDGPSCLSRPSPTSKRTSASASCSRG